MARARPELDDPEVARVMAGDAVAIGEDYPRGHALLEHLTPQPIGDEIPNGRRLLADVIEASGPGAESARHGPPHWARVAEWGLRIPETDPVLVLLFALLHDAGRLDDGRDPEHPARAVAMAHALNGGPFTLDPDRIELLADAIARHNLGELTDDPTVGACWDADRLDLARHAIVPDPAFMSTAAGRDLIAESTSPATPPFEDVLDRYRDRLAGLGSVRQAA